MVDVTVATFNVNGLRAILARRSTSIAEFLDSLQADVLCFQETKLTHPDLKQLQALACVPGWTSYFSFCREKSGYAGVATFCRAAAAREGAVGGGGAEVQAAAAASHGSNQVPTGCNGTGRMSQASPSSSAAGWCVTPLAAQEGLMGICPPQSPAAAAAAAAGQEQLLPGPWEELRRRFSWSEAVAMDAQGRALITDHGAFALFNLYLPATTDPTSPRFKVKLDLLEAVQLWCKALTAAGRHVMVVGDLNICAHPQDHCDFRAAPAAVQARYCHNRPDRAWLQQHITAELVQPPASPAAATPPAEAAAAAGTPQLAGTPGGPGLGASPGAAAPLPPLVFLDSWRALHPNHTRPFTVWNWRRGVRNDKHASRVDYILVAQGAPPQHNSYSKEGCTQQQAPGSPGYGVAAAPAPGRPHGSHVHQLSSSGVACSHGWSMQASVCEAVVWRDFTGSDHAPVKVVLRSVPCQLLHPPGWAGHPPSLAAENLFTQGSAASMQPKQRLITSLFPPLHNGSAQGSQEQAQGTSPAVTAPVGTVLEAMLNSTAMAELEAAAKQRYPLGSGRLSQLGGGIGSGTVDEGAAPTAAMNLAHVLMSRGGSKRSAEMAGLHHPGLAGAAMPANKQQPWKQQQQQQGATHCEAMTHSDMAVASGIVTGRAASTSLLQPPAPSLPGAAPATGVLTSDSSDEEQEILQQQQEMPEQEQQQVPAAGAGGRRVLRASGVRCYTAAGTVRLPVEPRAGPGSCSPPGG